MRNTRGFTLLELLVTVAVVAVLTAIAIPSMASVIRSTRLTAAHNDFLTSLYLLRSEAAKRNRTMKMCRTAAAPPLACDTQDGGGWDAGWAIWMDRDGDNRIDADETVVGVRQGLGAGVRITGNGSLANRIAYAATGAPRGFNNGTFTICVEGNPNRRQLIISAAGRIRVQKLRAEGGC